MKRLCGIVLLIATFWVSTSGETTNSKLRDADLAWDRGDYPSALNAYLSLLDSPDADRVLEPIALQTGELFQTTELTTDGGAPRFSADGRYLTYEIGRGAARKIRLAAADAPTRVVAELTGNHAAFSADGSHLAYLKLVATPAMLQLEAAADAAAGAERAKRLAELAQLTETAAEITIRDLSTGRERAIDVGTRRKNDVLVGAENTVLFTGPEADGIDQVHVTSDGRPPTAVTTGEPDKALQQMNATGTAATFTYRTLGRGAGAAPRFGVVLLPQGNVTIVAGSAPNFSGDGRTLAYIARTPEQSQLMLASAAAPAKAAAVRSGSERIDAPALSRDAGRIAFQMMPKDDWELFAINRDGRGEQRITREIQHDVLPRFLTSDRLLGLVGEPRHRRSYLYDLTSNRRIRLFHNNTVRTIAPEYEWVASPDGTKLLNVAERDGDTVSPERGVYLVDLARKVTIADVRARVQANLAVEEALRAKGKRLYAPIADDVRRVVGDASIARVYDYEKALFDFDSKHITQPGNKLASSYLFEAYKSFGYAPEYQWLAGRGALGGQTANVVATLKGTVNPELVYVVSSHYDSVAAGPGADDDSSGTSALLETARLLANHPQPATIVFASFTGEEAGLLGSREFVRRAVEGKMQVVGALNNDMIGWANDHRLDDTIRYSSPGIRDIQHAAAMQFSNLITYDALYYKGTDAAAYYEAYGDIVGGIGSYPVLGSPHYHQSHDVLETINHQLVTEVAKTTTATLMLLASSPSRLKNLNVDSYQHGAAAVSWTPSPEKGITAYIVAWGPPDKPESQQIRVTKPTAVVRAAPGTVIAVKAVNQRGLEGWDWAKTTIKTESK